MNQPASIEELIDRAREGDRDAFLQMAERCAGTLTAFVRSRMGVQLSQRIEPADVVQETHARALRSIREFRGRDEATVCRWFQVIAEHVILESARNATKGRTLQLDRDVAEGGISPSEGLRRNERFERLEEAITRLSPDHREVIRLARIEGLRIREIADRMQRSPDGVKQLLSRALKKLKETFGETESFHLPPRALEIEPSEGTQDNAEEMP